MIHAAARITAALFLFLAAAPALAVPIEVVFLANDGSAYGQFTFERRAAPDNRGSLTGGHLQIGTRIFDSTQLYYEYYQIEDSLGVYIRGDSTTGLPLGDFINLQFGNADAAWLDLPTRGLLGYNFGGVFESRTGSVTAVPEPLAAGLFAVGTAALAWRRRRRR